MSDVTKTPAALFNYADGGLYAEVTSTQKLPVQLEAIEKLSKKGSKNVA